VPEEPQIEAKKPPMGRIEPQEPEVESQVVSKADPV
jgi:hypothetical protein